MNNDLKNLRKQITDIDKKIIELLRNRISLSNQIGLIKIQKNLKIKDIKQEKIILARIKQIPHNPINTNDLIKIFTCIIKISRKSQKSTNKNNIKNGVENDNCDEK